VSDDGRDAAEIEQYCARLEAANRVLRERVALSPSLFDSRPEQVAALDEEGVIIAVNAAWKRCVAENGLPEPLGSNYLSLCDATAAHADVANAALAGQTDNFRHEYSCRVSGISGGFRARLTRIPLLLSGKCCGFRDEPSLGHYCLV